MIHLTRLNKTAIILNADLIEHMEVTPDTVICLTTGQKIRVQESAEEIVERVLAWRKLSSFVPGIPVQAPQPAEGMKEGPNGGAS